MSDYWQSEEVFLDGDQYFDRLLNDIHSAHSLITIEIYIFNDDLLGRKVAEALITAKRRGVKVEIIVDGVGSYTFFDRLYGEFSNANVPVKMFHPLPFYHPFYRKLSLKKKMHSLLTRLWRMNHRNHRKVITIDEHIMYLGSFNFSVEHTKDYDQKKWKDMGVRVVGENVKIAIMNFKKLWNLREYHHYRKKIKPLLKDLKNSPLRMSQTLFMKRFLYKDLLKRIQQSRSRIWLVTPYFIPKNRLIRAIGKASKRGVDVRILITAKSDIPFFKSLQFFYYPYLLMKGVKIFQFTDSVLHAKNFIIDDWMTIGSSNLNHRSILHDLEVDLSIQNQINKAIITEDFTLSTPPELEITSQHLKQRTLFDTFLSRLYFVFKYWF